jgi:hypothetical protein
MSAPDESFRRRHAAQGSISDPRERQRFALGATVAMLSTPRRLRSGLSSRPARLLLSSGPTGLSRATVGHDGLGSMSVLLPPVMLFAIGFLCARSTGLGHPWLIAGHRRRHSSSAASPNPT